MGDLLICHSRLRGNDKFYILNTKSMIDLQKTKIVATIGPASESVEKLEQLMVAGLDVARLNFSHGTHQWHTRTMANIRSVADKTGCNVAIVADLQGPRVRTRVAEVVAFETGEQVVIYGAADELTVAQIAQIGEGKKVIGIDSPETVANLKVGQRIFIEDGLKQLMVREVGARVVAEVITGGEIANHKGINLPDTDVPLPALTDKDIADLEFALAHGVDYVALSFVRTARDVADLRERIAQAQSDMAPELRTKIIVKIERPEAITNLDEIVAATDAVMVARGDLATEVGPARVAVLQKQIIAKSMHALKPVIVATQMLASMEENPAPTRAEISDVTNAVIDHTDAVMLSGESAGGQYPVESVTMMHDIIAATEESPFDDVTVALSGHTHAPIVALAEQVIAHVRARSIDTIVCVDKDAQVGALAAAIAHYRPARRVIVLTDNRTVRRQLALVWGVQAYYHPEVAGKSASEVITTAREIAQIDGTITAIVNGDIVDAQ